MSLLSRCLGRYRSNRQLPIFYKLVRCSRLPSPTIVSNWWPATRVRVGAISSFSCTPPPGQPLTLKEQNLVGSPDISCAISAEATVSELIQLLLNKSSELSNADDISTAIVPLQELLLHTLKCKQRTTEEMKLLKEFVHSNLKLFNIKFLPLLLTTLLKNNCISVPILEESTALFSWVLKNDLKKYQNVNFGQVFWLLGRCFYYNEQLCEALSEIFKGPDSILNPWLVSNIAWYCARVRFYSPTLLDDIANYTLANNHKFNYHDLSNVVYSFGYLNHPHPALMDTVGRRLEGERNTEGNEQVYWVYVWSCLVLDMLRVGVLERVLNEEFIQASLKSAQYDICLLQLSIALNYEHPELNMAGEDTGSPLNKWGVCFPSVKGLDNKYMRQSTLNRLQKYRHSGSANRFGENIKRALKQVVGKGLYYNSEALSLSGYSVDFELLLDSDNKLVTIPRRWKMKYKEDVLYSISVLKKSKKRLSLTSSLVDSLEKAENSNNQSESELSLPSSFEYRVQINLASDWGAKFELLPRSVKRRLAIEADGLPHFASNCDHVMGPTVLKHRQLRALGWEVVQIPYREWEELDSGDDHVRYLAKKIFSRT